MPRNLSNAAKREIVLLKEMDARAKELGLLPDPKKDIPLATLTDRLKEAQAGYERAKIELELWLVITQNEREKVAECVLEELS